MRIHTMQCMPEWNGTRSSMSVLLAALRIRSVIISEQCRYVCAIFFYSFATRLCESSSTYSTSVRFTFQSIHSPFGSHTSNKKILATLYFACTAAHTIRPTESSEKNIYIYIIHFWLNNALKEATENLLYPIWWRQIVFHIFFSHLLSFVRVHRKFNFIG